LRKEHNIELSITQKGSWTGQGQRPLEHSSHGNVLKILRPVLPLKPTVGRLFICRSRRLSNTLGQGLISSQLEASLGFAALVST